MNLSGVAGAKEVTRGRTLEVMGGGGTVEGFLICLDVDG